MSKHTPGPWHVSGSGPTVYALHDQPQRNRFTATMQGGRRDDAPLLELVANANLCAAAPDMLEALQSLVRAVEQFTSAVALGWPELEQAKAAITQATGEQA